MDEFDVNLLVSRLDFIKEQVANGEVSIPVAEEIYLSLERYILPPEKREEEDRRIMDYVFRGWMLTHLSENTPTSTVSQSITSEPTD